MVPSVIIDEVGAILRLGLRDVLDGAGIAVVADAGSADAAVIDLDASDCRDRADALMSSFPGLTVIACSTQRPSMLVLAGEAEAGERPFTPGALRATVRRAAASRWPA
jgi:hypothetical protein